MEEGGRQKYRSRRMGALWHGLHILTRLRGRLGWRTRICQRTKILFFPVIPPPTRPTQNPLRTLELFIVQELWKSVLPAREFQGESRSFLLPALKSWSWRKCSVVHIFAVTQGGHSQLVFSVLKHWWAHTSRPLMAHFSTVLLYWRGRKQVRKNRSRELTEECKVVCACLLPCFRQQHSFTALAQG